MELLNSVFMNLQAQLIWSPFNTIVMEFVYNFSLFSGIFSKAKNKTVWGAPKTNLLEGNPTGYPTGY